MTPYSADYDGQRPGQTGRGRRRGWPRGGGAGNGPRSRCGPHASWPVFWNSFATTGCSRCGGWPPCAGCAAAKSARCDGSTSTWTPAPSRSAGKSPAPPASCMSARRRHPPASAPSPSTQPPRLYSVNTGRRLRPCRRNAANVAADDAGRVFTWPDGRPLSPDWLSHRFRHLVTESGLGRRSRMSLAPMAIHVASPPEPSEYGTARKGDR